MVIKIDDGRCAPIAQGNFKKYKTCYSADDVKTLARMYNSYVSPSERLSLDRSPRELYAALRARVSECKNEHEACLLHHLRAKSKDPATPPDLTDQLMKKFRPKMPSSWKKNNREWLNTYNIYHVMMQYEDACPEFEFLGVFPVDFAQHTTNGTCIIRKMCTFTLADFLSRGKKHFGMVINLDRHDQSGSHWVALFASFDPKRNFGMVYYDSAGREPPDPVKDFMREVKNEVTELLFHRDAASFKTFYNQVPYQKKNTECGMFAMVFIIACLENKRKRVHCVRRLLDKHKLHDDKVHELRKYLYSSPDTPVTNDASSVYRDD